MSINQSEKYQAENDQPHYWKFELKELGVDAAAFLKHVQPFYDTFPWDLYDVQRYGIAKPTRRRVIADYTLQTRDNTWDILRIPAKPYEQPDYGGIDRAARVFPEAPTELTDYPELLKLQTAVADMVRSVRADVRKLQMTLTFLRTLHDREHVGICTFEQQPHTDGTDYIVSALVTKRVNLKPQSGESSVYTLKKDLLMNTVLQPGEGIFQDDRNLMHHITNIEQETPESAGIRDILGVDVQVLP
jgi:hypothetical protein